MAYYLQFDGVDDRLTTPSFTYTAIVMDFKVNSKAAFERYWSLPFSAEYFQVATGGVNDQWSAGVSTFQKDGVGQTNNTVIMTTGTRAVARAVFASAKTNTCYFMHNNSAAYAHGDIWDIKFYNEATLVCHYDMSTQTVNDQSGNGRHGTLVGGTFVNEGGTVYEVTGAASSISSASASAVLVANVDGAAVAMSSAAGAAVLTANVSGSASAVSSGSATALLVAPVTGTAQAISSASCDIPQSGVHSVTGNAVSTSSASASVVRVANVAGTAAAVSSASGSAAAKYVAAGQSVSTSTASYNEMEGVQYMAVLMGVRSVPIVLRGERSANVTLTGKRRNPIVLRGEKMTARNQNFEMFAGDTAPLKFLLYEADGTTPTDLTGASIDWVLQREAGATDAVRKSLADGITVVTGGVEIALAKADTEEYATGTYYHVVRVTSAAGLVSTYALGTAKITNTGI